MTRSVIRSASPVGASGPASRPRAVVLAVRLMFAHAVVSGLSVLSLLVLRGRFTASLRAQRPRPTQASIDTSVTILLVTGAVLAVAYVLLTRHVSLGRQRARVLTWGLVGLGVLAGISALQQPEPGPRRVLTVLALLFEVAIAALLVTAPADRYFRTAVPRRSRRRPRGV